MRVAVLLSAGRSISRRVGSMSSIFIFLRRATGRWKTGTMREKQASVPQLTISRV